MSRAMALSRLLSSVRVSSLANLSLSSADCRQQHSLSLSHCCHHFSPRFPIPRSPRTVEFSSVKSLTHQVYCCQVRSVSNSTVAMSQQTALDISKALQDHGIVPDVIASAVTGLVQVSYSSGVSVDLGNTLTPTQVKGQPEINWPLSDPGALYTLVLTDPDAPSRANPEFGQWRHWLVANVPGSGHVTSGEVITDYVGSGPPKDTGLHRYVFLVYKQPGKISVAPELIASKHKASGREKWNVAKFASDYNLGEPIAVNFYQAEYDDYVPQLYAQFTED